MVVEGTVKEVEQLARAATLEALSNVVRNGEGSAVELVAKTVAGAESGVFEQVLGQFVKPGSLLPDRGILEVFIGHGNLLGLGLSVWIGI